MKIAAKFLVFVRNYPKFEGITGVLIFMLCPAALQILLDLRKKDPICDVKKANAWKKVFLQIELRC